MTPRHVAPVGPLCRSISAASRTTAQHRAPLDSLESSAFNQPMCHNGDQPAYTDRTSGTSPFAHPRTERTGHSTSLEARRREISVSIARKRRRRGWWRRCWHSLARPEPCCKALRSYADVVEAQDRDIDRKTGGCWCSYMHAPRNEATRRHFVRNFAANGRSARHWYARARLLLGIQRKAEEMCHNRTRCAASRIQLP